MAEKRYADINGLTEAGSTLLLDGSADGIQVDSDGIFTINRRVDLEGAIRKSMTLTVIDKAGNRNTTTIYAVDGDVTALESLTIKLVGDDGKLKDIELVDGFKTIAMNTGETVKFDAVNSYLTSEGSVKEFEILPEQLNWSVIHGSNLIDFGAGTVYAKVPGEAILKAGTLSAGFRVDEESDEQQVSTEDIVILKIEGEPIYELPPVDDGSGRRDRTTTSTGISLSELMSRLVATIGQKNVIKAISLYSSRQESIALNESLGVIVPIDSVDKNDILLIYKPKNAEELKAKAKGTVLGDVMTLDTVTGQELKKPVIFVYDYSKDDVSAADNVGWYKYNELFDKWEYVLGENNTEAKKFTAEADDMDGFYVFIDNPNFIRFSDIAGNWAEKYIYGLSSLSVINGIKEGDKYSFYPNRDITRAEFIKLAVAAMRLDPDDYKDVELPFDDAEKIPAWALNYIKVAYKMGWLKGKGTGNGLVADATASISREEAVTMLHRIKAAAYEEGSASFTDSDSISGYAREAVENFASSQIVNGYTDGSFKPLNDIARSEAAKIVAEWINKALK